MARAERLGSGARSGKGSGDEYNVHEARKPMFDLRPADGAIGSHAQLVQACREDFEALGQLVLAACGL